VHDWINTYTGRKFYPLNPDPDEIDILDIAHALSMQCRFTGHVKQFYSVAQHSVNVARHVPHSDQLWALLHDAAEAYLVDLARPIKHAPGFEAYREAEKLLMDAVQTQFHLNGSIPASIHEADSRMLITEAQSLLQIHPEWKRDWVFVPYDEVVIGLPPLVARAEFMTMFDNLFYKGEGG